jgi:CRISPR type IV-associated protein Csf1
MTMTAGPSRGASDPAPCLSEIICRQRNVDPPKGTLSGKCMICGRMTDRGHEFRDSGSFTTYHLILGGDCLCPECAWVREQREFRSSMWAVGSDGFRLFKLKEARDLLVHPPEPPFQMFFTKSWKKPGWIALANRLNLSRDRFTVALDYDLIEVRADLRNDYLSHIDRLLAAGATKTEIESGRLKAKTFAKVKPADARLLTERAGSPLWALCTYVARKEEDEPNDDSGKGTA